MLDSAEFFCYKCINVKAQHKRHIMKIKGKLKQTQRKPKAKAYGLAHSLIAHLRFYQKRIDDAQDQFMADPEVFRAIINACTGSGKTENFIVLIKKLVVLAHEAGMKRVLVAHPRLALSMDQQKRLKKALDKLDIGYSFTSFHSGEVMQTTTSRRNTSTTDRQQLEEYRDSCCENLHITFTSYASLHKIADMEYDLIVCDEAHYLCQGQYKKSLHLFRDDAKVLFYTATPVAVTAQEESMTNKDFFGKVIAEVPPKELIPFGFVVPPRVRFMNVKTTGAGNAIDYAATIAEAYKDQLAQVNKKFVHKMLVAMANTSFFDDIMADIVEMRKIVGKDIDVYYVSAERCKKNGKPYANREELLEDFAKNENYCVIIHCDTLAEGIDVDGLGGVLLLRNLGKAKSIQTIGRACRPFKGDFKKDGTLNKNRIKTEAIVTIAMADSEWISNSNAKEWSAIFKDGGYNEMWEYVDPEFKEEGGKREPGELENNVYKTLEDVRFSDILNDNIAAWETYKEKANA